MERREPKRLASRMDFQVTVLLLTAVILAAAGPLLLCAVLTPARAWPWALLWAAAVAGLSCLWARRQFRRISNPSYRDLANTDYLTRLKSRNAFETDLDNLGAGDRDGVGVILVDLDNLKGVNDTLGHTAGDQYLRSAADAVWDVPRRCSAAYRVGGDEFALLVRHTEEEELARLAGQIEERFAQIRPRWDQPLSLSVGWAAYDGDRDGDPRDTYRRADQRMYANKRAGREP